MEKYRQKYIRLLWIAGILTVIFKGIMMYAYEITECDDLWQYYNCLMISKGGVIYRDFACVTTPLFYFIFSIPLFFVKSYTAMKVMQLVMMIILVVVLYRLIVRMELLHSLGIYLYAIITICMAFFPFEYNALVTILTITLMALMVRFCDENPSSKEMVYYGLISSALILTKQTTGTVIVFTSVMVFLLCSKQGGKIKQIAAFFLTAASCASVFLIYLWKTKSFTAFWKNCFSGAKSFSKNSNLATIFQFGDTYKDVLLVQVVVFVLFFGLMVIAIRDKDRKLKMISWIALAHTVVIYPIPNIKHLELALIVNFIPLIYFVSGKIDLTREAFVKKLNGIFYSILAVAVGYALLMIPNTSHAQKIQTKYVHSFVDSETYHRTKDIIKYVKENPEKKIYSIEDVYSFVSFATEQIPEPYFNIFLQGNLANYTSEDILKKIEGQNETYIYIYHNKQEMFWQTPPEARTYIEKNYKYVERCGKFDIYRVR